MICVFLDFLVFSQIFCVGFLMFIFVSCTLGVFGFVVDDYQKCLVEIRLAKRRLTKYYWGSMCIVEPLWIRKNSSYLIYYILYKSYLECVLYNHSALEKEQFKENIKRLKLPWNPCPWWVDVNIWQCLHFLVISKHKISKTKNPQLCENMTYSKWANMPNKVKNVWFREHMWKNRLNVSLSYSQQEWADARKQYWIHVTFK